MSLPEAWYKPVSVGICLGRTCHSYPRLVGCEAGCSLKHRSAVFTAKRSVKQSRFVIFLQNVCPQGHSLYSLFYPWLHPKPVLIITNHARQDWLYDKRRVRTKGCALHWFWLQPTFLLFVVEGPSQCSAVCWWSCPASCHAAAAAGAAAAAEMCGPYVSLKWRRSNAPGVQICKYYYSGVSFVELCIENWRILGHLMSFAIPWVNN